jgi:integrase
MDDVRNWLDAREATEGVSLRGRVWLFPDETGEVTRYTHRNSARPWKRATAKAAELFPDAAERLADATPYTLRASCVSAYVRAAGRDLDWARLAARMGHTVKTMQEYYLYVVAALETAERVAVEEQIVQARRQTGSGRSGRALLSRVLSEREPARQKLIDLEARRQRRAS